MNKQIEEMAREMCHLSAECETCQICDEKYHGDGDPCYFQCVAKEIVNHGYRKSTDVAREIFEEAEKVFMVSCVSFEAYAKWQNLKKKYTESEVADDEAQAD